jgi:NAD(P)H-dependent FMN reductase
VTTSGDSQVAVIIGSTRPGRICPGIAQWVQRVAQQDSPVHYNLIDLAEVNLPFLDEPLPAAQRQYKNEHTRAWSRLVDAHAGFLFVFPQYNWGYPAPLKNALDFLYHEWAAKPASFVTYGTRGGSKGAEQIHGVLQGLKMQELDAHLEVFISDKDVDQNGQLIDVEALMAPYHTLLRAIDAQMLEALTDHE